ncbi:XrtA/PEP-CTERM system histidine kinase PrsK [Erythrobacter sp.]|jgi:putative PEP-CTERM system histidine kinase|uniref:XrtA/PEP-CTERM system histidine kinase PrsK n=1 Tax=Erythrobacter sp. TaxID=1042 RepID=UPI002EAAC453|nr:XrtA/PEP-CTERM system histidine kinase PrsK [Erythrobacter sp.]
MMELTNFGGSLALFCYGTGAVLCAGAALWIARYGDRMRPDRTAALVALAATLVWCSVSIGAGAGSALVGMAATARNLALIALVFRLFAADGRDESLKPIRPVIITVALVQLFQPILLFIEAQSVAFPELVQLTREVSRLLNMLVAIGMLMLLHNLYAGAAAVSRRIIMWSAIGLAVLFAFELNLYTIAYLAAGEPAVLQVLNGFVAGGTAVLFAIGANSRSADLHFRPSRTVTFQSLSLVVIGSYLALVVLITRSLELLGSDIARAGQIVVVVLAAAAAFLWLPSRRIRSWLRVTATKHFFQHRYEYREEWLRFTRTIGEASPDNASFHERAVKAVADITDSPAGLLLMPDEEAQLVLTARWNWPTLEVPAVASAYALAGLLEEHHHIVDLDEVRAGIDHHGETAHVPQWLGEAGDAWALVPLVHFDRLVGAIVLARPRIERRLDWEDFDLLKVVGQQLASYLAEQAGQQALMDANRFDEFNRRMAFVMHDIKNLASQLSLLSANAQKHADNPDFRADMLITLRKSSEKLNALLDRLGRYGGAPAQDVGEVDLTALAGRVEERFAGIHPVRATGRAPVRVLGDAEALEQAITHLVQNAVDASEKAVPVMLDIGSDGLYGRFDIIDAGTGMSPEFVRAGLFKPFVSSKTSGFGIGAFEAREMIRAMGGRLAVESREGVGTRFTINLPIPDAARLAADRHESSSKEVA